MALISAHIGEHSVYSEPNQNGGMPQSWVRHQIVTTCDFATHNKLIINLFGGFNHHVVHHLFPNICHVHYPEVAKILKLTTAEYNLPYYHYTTFWQAIVGHGEMLKMLGSEENPEPQMAGVSAKLE